MVLRHRHRQSDSNFDGNHLRVDLLPAALRCAFYLFTVLYISVTFCIFIFVSEKWKANRNRCLNRRKLRRITFNCNIQKLALFSTVQTRKAHAETICARAKIKTSEEAEQIDVIEPSFTWCRHWLFPTTAIRSVATWAHCSFIIRADASTTCCCCRCEKKRIFQRPQSARKRLGAASGWG